jgi:homoserine dehydrogenase
MENRSAKWYNGALSPDSAAGGIRGISMTIGVGVIGAGTVGGGVIETLTRNTGLIEERTGKPVRLTHVADLDADLIQSFNLSSVTESSDAAALINDPNVQIVCELIGGVKPAKQFILDALNAKKHVVTANKMLLAHHGPELAKAAADNGVQLRYEAAVAGGIPIIKALREGLAANHIEYIYGILNGTCNYILSRMTYESLEFEDVLQQAIAHGFAETPPDLDIQGADTAHKCQIMASLAFGTEVNYDDIYVEGITAITHADVAYAQELGYIIKLLAVIRADDDHIQASVYPALIDETHLLAAVRNEFNAIYVQSDIADATLYYGRGAGKLPTASAVVADILDISRGDGPATPAFRYGTRKPIRPIGETTGRFYLRLTTIDRPGILGKACTILGDRGVSIASCMQLEEHTPDAVHIVIMTHGSKESDVQAAVAEIDALDSTREPAHVIRVLED